MRTRTPKGTFAKEQPNDVTFSADVTTILIEKRNGEKLSCVVDNEDYEKVKDYKWGAIRRSHTEHAAVEHFGEFAWLNFPDEVRVQ